MYLLLLILLVAAGAALGRTAWRRRAPALGWLGGLLILATLGLYAVMGL